jgi:hypothetical protein
VLAEFFFVFIATDFCALSAVFLCDWGMVWGFGHEMHEVSKKGFEG